MAGIPPKNGTTRFAMPCATSSIFERCFPPIIPSATTAESRLSIAPRNPIAAADGIARGRYEVAAAGGVDTTSDAPIAFGDDLRRALLGTIEHPILREMIMAAPLKGIEQFVVVDDPVAYEEWFAKQPKPHFPPMNLPESYKADILHVTKDNPPWARGEYLGYYRPPVPRHLFDADMGPPDEDAAPPAPAACTSEPESEPEPELDPGPGPAIEPDSGPRPDNSDETDPR